ncbi:unnamed protein product [Mytilus edulis]|uniref:C-type lectin domain-containing protein n=1 Tax=Mytilus edulis TaxID=6550 RepID=A0A8S3RRC8_MYTED|nr:unnamed protein product [Mytilus edulis]
MQASCQAHHAELVVIETADENAFIYSIMTKLGGYFWLDGTDEYSEGQWEWASTGYALDYSNWFPGEPNNDGDEDCLASCQAHHAELAVIETNEENTFIWSEMTKLGGFFWLDGTDKFSEGQWEWASTGEPLDYSNWFPGEPNNSNGQEDCLLTGGVYKTFWNDSPCSNQIKYICEKK